MSAQKPGSIHPREKGDLAGCALGEARYPQTGIQGPQEQSRLINLPSGNQGSSQQTAESWHSSIRKWIPFSGRPQPNSI